MENHNERPECIDDALILAGAIKNCTNVLETKLREAAQLLNMQEPRLMSAADFDDNPNVDAGGFLPCWVECNDKEIEFAVRDGFIKPGETLNGWTTTRLEEMPGQAKDNPNVRYWTSRHSDERRKATAWEAEQDG